jgi:CHAD domain-containing protein
MIAAQRDELVRHETAVLLDADPKGVHKMRVAIRRLRALLHAARPAVDRTWADDLRDELSWLADRLAPVRDADVLIGRLQTELVSLGPDAIHGRALLTALDQDRRSARGQLLEALETDRYRRLLNAVEAAAGEPWIVNADVTLETMAEREFRAARKHARRLGSPPSDADLHRLRILVKRARYAAELLDPTKKKVAKFLERATALQTVLGEHQDAVVADAELRDAARRANRSDAWVVAGRLIEREQEQRARARRAFGSTWKKYEKAGRKV